MDTSSASADTTDRAWWPPLPEAEGFTHTIVETPGLRTHVASVGAGEPVVLLHGFPQHWWQWREVAPRIAARGFRVICPDLRGSGWTEAEDPRFGADSQMNDVLALMDALGIERAHIVGHDMGAISVMLISYRHPHRVLTSVQLAVPPGFMIFTPKVVPAFSHMPKLLLHRTGRSLRYLFSDRYLAHPLSDDVIDGYLRVQQRPEVARAVSAMYRGMVIPVVFRLSNGTFKRMRLHPPTLTVFGRKDWPFTEENARRVSRDHRRRADRFELAFVDDAAHFIVDDAPDAVAAVVLDWIEREGSAA